VGRDLHEDVFIQGGDNLGSGKDLGGSFWGKDWQVRKCERELGGDGNIVWKSKIGGGESRLSTGSKGIGLRIISQCGFQLFH